MAEALEVEPGRLLGPDDVQLEISEAEMTLVDLVRRIRISPAEAIARLAGLEVDAG